MMSKIMERLVFMQIEDNIVTFEKEDGSTIMYPAKDVPKEYKQGDIIKVVLYGDNFIDSNDCIEFYGLDIVEMERRRSINSKRCSRIRDRIFND